MTLAQCSLYASYATSCNHQHAEPWNSHRTIRFRFRQDMPADIRPHPVPAGFQKIKSGRSLAESFDKSYRWRSRKHAETSRTKVVQ